MRTSPGSLNPSGADPLDPDPTGQDPSADDPAGKEKALLQAGIFAVTPEARGRSLPEIRSLLQKEFRRRGVAAPTMTWLDAVASAAFYGQPYIIDLPAALAADAAVAAPSRQVRRRLAARRELRDQQLPAGILPPASAWRLDDNEVTGHGPAAGGRTEAYAGPGGRIGVLPMLAAAAAGAAALLCIEAIRAASARRTAAKGPTAGGA